MESPRTGRGGAAATRRVRGNDGSWRRRDAELTAALGVLLGDYRPATPGWELVAVAEKLVLTGFLALFEPGSWMQLFLGTVAALFAFVLQSRVQPYRTPTDNLFAYLASLALVPIFLGSLGLQTEALGLSVDSVVIVAILFTDLLKGIFFGWAVALVLALASAKARKNVTSPALTKDESGDGIRFVLADHVVFLHKAGVANELAEVPDGSKVVIDGKGCENLDLDVLDAIHEFAVSAGVRNIDYQLVGIPAPTGVGGH